MGVVIFLKHVVMEEKNCCHEVCTKNPLTFASPFRAIIITCCREIFYAKISYVSWIWTTFTWLWRYDFRLELNLGNDLGAKTYCLAQVNLSGPWENT